MGSVSEVEKYVESYVKENNRLPDLLELRTDFWLKFAEEQKEKGLDTDIIPVWQHITDVETFNG